MSTRTSSLSVQQPLDIRQPAGLHFISFTLLLAECQAHQLPLVLLDAKDVVFDGALDDQAEDAAVFLLAEAVDAIDGLVFYCGRPPTV
jgi:hypothetical protein